MGDSSRSVTSICGPCEYITPIGVRVPHNPLRLNMPVITPNTWILSSLIFLLLTLQSRRRSLAGSVCSEETVMNYSVIVSDYLKTGRKFKTRHVNTSAR